MLEQHQNLIRAVVFRMAGATTSHADLEDVVQSVNLRLLETGLQQFDPTRGSIEAFITVMAKSMTIDSWRRAQKRPILAGDELIDDSSHENSNTSSSYLKANDLQDHIEDALTMLLREEQRDQLESVIKRLPPDDQHFLLISMRDDYDNRAYAERLGVTEVVLRVRKFRIAERIRAFLSEVRS